MSDESDDDFDAIIRGSAWIKNIGPAPASEAQMHPVDIERMVCGVDLGYEPSSSVSFQVTSNPYPPEGTLLMMTPRAQDAMDSMWRRSVSRITSEVALREYVDQAGARYSGLEVRQPSIAAQVAIDSVLADMDAAERRYRRRQRRMKSQGARQREQRKIDLRSRVSKAKRKRRAVELRRPRKKRWPL